MLSAPGYLNRYCPVCQSAEQQPYARKADHEVVKCIDCRFVFTRSIPSERELFEYYLDHHSTQPATSRRRRSISLRVKYWMLSQLIQWMSPRQPIIRTLELGCGDGLFLETVQDNPRFHATGLDVCQKSVEKALQKVLDAHHSDLESKHYPDNTFDFIFAFHQLEHVQNPERLVLEMQRILKPGGYLFLALPSISHLGARLAGRRWKHLTPPEHLWYFSPRTLSRFVTRLGFRATFSSGLSPRTHLYLFARKLADVSHTAIPRWMGIHPAEADASDDLTRAA